MKILCRVCRKEFEDDGTYALHTMVCYAPCSICGGNHFAAGCPRIDDVTKEITQRLFAPCPSCISLCSRLVLAEKVVEAAEEFKKAVEQNTIPMHKRVELFAALKSAREGGEKGERK